MQPIPPMGASARPDLKEVTDMLVQLSDLHIRAPGVLTYKRIDTSVYTQRAVDKVLSLPALPAAAVMTGDLTDFGGAAEYAHLEQLLQPLMAQMPVYLVMGNHDQATALRAQFPQMAHLHAGPGDFVQYAVYVGGMRLVVLDTTVPGEHYGCLCALRLQWLADTLAQDAQTPTVIAMHHPPFETMFGPMDAFGLLQGREALAEIVRAAGNVQRIVCGHLHRSIQCGFAGTVAMTAPSVAHQLHFELGKVAQSAWNLEPAAFVLHAMNSQQQIVSHTVTTVESAGPYPFWDAQGKLID